MRSTGFLRLVVLAALLGLIWPAVRPSCARAGKAMPCCEKGNRSVPPCCRIERAPEPGSSALDRIQVEAPAAAGVVASPPAPRLLAEWAASGAASVAAAGSLSPPGAFALRV